MNKIAVTASVDVSSTRCIKLKELLKRLNLHYEERMEGNAVIIDIKAKPLEKKPAQQLEKDASMAGLAIL